MTVWMVAGPAASGKTTLGRALAWRLGAVMLDLDTVTNPLLDALGDQIAPGGHWNDPRLRASVRPARYAALLAVASDQVVDELVLVAPFTAELRGGAEWSAVLDAVRPALPRVAWLDGPPRLFAARREVRGEARDRFLAADPEPPRVRHQRVDAAATTEAQVAALLS